LWAGQKKNKGFHLVTCELLPRPKGYGGWDLNNLHHFGLALASKTLWSILNGTGLWSNIIMDKYF